MKFEDIPIILKQYPDAIDLAMVNNDYVNLDFQGLLRQVCAKINANDYPLPRGSFLARKAISKEIALVHGIDFDPNNEVVVCNGSSQALKICLDILVKCDESVVIFEPFYPPYSHLLSKKGVDIKYVKLNPPNWEFERSELHSAFSSKTSLVIVNTPHNPTGKIFTASELQMILDLCNTFNAKALIDDVYQRLLPANKKQFVLSEITNNKDKIIIIGSLSKSLNLSGLRIGWLAGSRSLVSSVEEEMLLSCIGVNNFCQSIIEQLMPLSNVNTNHTSQNIEQYRKYVWNQLKDTKLHPYKSDGTCYIVVNAKDLEMGKLPLWKVLLDATGVLLMDLTEFYSSGSQNEAVAMLRLCYTRNKNVLDEALFRLRKWSNGYQ